ncbi:MAG: hypothetical protein VKK63_00570 [Synechococcus sp.]|nr:hypothetical protein [Synechococcus sp.]
MAIKLQNGSVLFKNGMPSCECCDDGISDEDNGTPGVLLPTVGCPRQSVPCSFTTISRDLALLFRAGGTVSVEYSVTGTYQWSFNSVTYSAGISESGTYEWTMANLPTCNTGGGTTLTDPQMLSQTGGSNVSGTVSLAMSINVKEVGPDGGPFTFCMQVSHSVDISASTLLRVQNTFTSFLSHGSSSGSLNGVADTSNIYVVQGDLPLGATILQQSSNFSQVATLNPSAP